MSVNCATGSIAPFFPSAQNPWDEKKIKHLYSRLGFGATPAEIQAGLALSPGQLVDNLIQDAKNTPLPASPPWHNWSIADYTDFGQESFAQYREWYFLWLTDMLNSSVREKVALFWHNHFVTQFFVYNCPSYLFEYHKLLLQYAFGNFQDFVKAIGKTPAMLTFLDGVLNVKAQPNENYARELFELFTLGANNGYTQTDIEEASRALTGYTSVGSFCEPVLFNPADFDNGAKTIFGQTANFDFDGVHDLIFQQRPVEVSEFIARKVYKHFVHALPDEAIVASLAQTLRNNNFELEPMFKELFKSEHFYDPEVIGVQIKSPVDYLISLPRSGALPYDAQIIELAGYLTGDMGQLLFNPIDVSGWSGNRKWINGAAITRRWEGLGWYVDYVVAVLDKEKLRDLAMDLAGLTNDVNEVAQKLADHFLPHGLFDAASYQEAATALKWQIPQNYFDNGFWNLTYHYAPEQVWNFLKWLIRRPEFQLN